MPDKVKCSKCGAPLPVDVPGQLCLRCLLQFGLKVDRSSGPPMDPESATASFAAGPMSDQFGRYRVIERIGEGGCGVVYRAEQVEPLRREVALKVIKLGMDTRNVIARFGAERQALAMMDHPGIARVFDGGASSTGRPYFVMELVSGEPITAYCKRHGLALEDLLRLFIELCQAVQHAHQKGIIHRDLKPSNILVVEQDGRPRPKVIDFGVAKATARQRLSDDTIYTAFDQFVGTPAYMSPEQAGLTGEDVDTRSDIYSLGVLLYELLTGQPPFDPERLRRAALDEVCRIIRTEEPLRPSKLVETRSELRGKKPQAPEAQDNATLNSQLKSLSTDLDWIVMKALEKQPASRYGTAKDFARDIEHHLNGEPIRARPPSALYRLQKTVRRNKLLFGAGTAVLLAFLAGFALSPWRFVKEQQAHGTAVAAEQPVPKMATRSERVSRLLGEILPGHAASPDTLLRLADALIAREKLAEAEDVLREAITLLTKLHDPEVLGTVRVRLIEVLNGLQKWVEAEAIARENVTLWRQQPNAHDWLLDALHWQAIMCVNQGKWAEAEPLQREALQLCDEVKASGATFHSPLFCLHLRCGLARVLVRQRKFVEAEPLLLAAYAGLKGMTGMGDAANEEVSMKLLVELCEATNRPDEAAEWRRKLAAFQSTHPGDGLSGKH